MAKNKQKIEITNFEDVTVEEPIEAKLEEVVICERSKNSDELEIEALLNSLNK
jgi:hypothetical protein